jgi:hypothetical protein
MNTRTRSRLAWETVRERLVTSGGTASVPKALFPHPRDAGASPSSTWPVGQIADYTLDNAYGQAPLVIREFPDRFEAFLDAARVATQVIAAVEGDSSKATYVGAAMLGGAIGTSVSNKREGMLLGAALGLLFAALIDSSLNETRRLPG